MATTEDIWFTSKDGLKLHALSNSISTASLPVICLSGISRTAEDFRTLLAVFSAESCPRPALALDSRGRGLSDRDKNPANYSVPIELADAMSFLENQKIRRAIFIGTSRGGILTMALASILPSAIAGAVLNDVGPQLEMQGLLRIKSYVGKMRKPENWSDAIEQLKSVMGTHFPAFGRADWEGYARRTWRKDFEPCSDPALSTAFEVISADNPPPTLWPQFEALAKTAPLLVLRGEHSDLLSRETIAEMKQRAPRMEAIEIHGQGHAPALERDEVIRPILQFVARCDPA